MEKGIDYLFVKYMHILREGRGQCHLMYRMLCQSRTGIGLYFFVFIRCALRVIAFCE